MRKALLIVIVWSISSDIFSQQQFIDSLLKTLSVQSQDTGKLNTLSQLGRAYVASQPDTALKYITALGSLSEKLKYAKGTIEFYFLMMHYHNFKSQSDSAIWYGKKMAEAARNDNNIEKMVKAYLKVGEIYAFNGDVESGLNYCFDGIKQIKGTKAFTPAMESDFSVTIANIYLTNNDYQKARPYYEKALEIRRDLGKEWEYNLLPPLINLGNIYMHMGDLSRSEKMYMEALGITQKHLDVRHEGMVYQGLTEVYDRKNNLPEMKSYAEKALGIATQVNDSNNIFMGMHNLAVYYMKTNDFAKSKPMLIDAVKIAGSLGDKNSEYAIYLSLSENEAAQHNYPEMTRYRDSADKIHNRQFTEATALHQGMYEARYKTLEKETRIKLQQAVIRQKNILNYILAGSAIGLIILAGSGYRNYTQKQKLQLQRITELETEKKLAATEAVLKGEEQERTRLAKDLHDGLGGMLSGIKYSFQTMKGNLIMTPENQQAFERSIDMLDSSIKEMRRVAHNMMPEALLKFGLDTALKDFCNDINQSGVLKITYQSNGLENTVIDQTTAITIYRIVQELVNNTIKHAGASSAIVQVDKSEKGITLTVEDNGKGFDTKILKYKGGIGWSNIQSRIDYLKGKLDVQSEPGKGTSVLVELNINA
ncbi:MAG: tetratricopeptide repeat protein [Agriterribacter sp.]